MHTYTHPISGTLIEGVQLLSGSILRETDLYDSSDGTWRTCSRVADLKIEPYCETIWVRQPEPLSENAQQLLSHLFRQPWGPSTCLGKRAGSFYVIPSPRFNWDGRFGIENKPVIHPECVQELVDHGYLVAGRYAPVNCESDYSMMWGDHRNTAYILTDDGREEGRRIAEC